MSFLWVEPSTMHLEEFRYYQMYSSERQASKPISALLKCRWLTVSVGAKAVSTSLPQHPLLQVPCPS